MKVKSTGFIAAVAAVTSAFGGDVAATLTLADGSVIKGTVKTESLEVESVLGTLAIPVAKIAGASFTATTAEKRACARKGVQLWAGGPFWAEMNVGAEKPEDVGYYFWWGDTVGYVPVGTKPTTFVDSTPIRWAASDGSNGDFAFSAENAPTFRMSPVALQDGWVSSEGHLKPEHDAAQVQWGKEWRMPTDEELGGLVDRCDWRPETLNGVEGYRVSGRGDFKGASIFLPRAGDGDERNLNYTMFGYYWSSVPSRGNAENAHALDFDSYHHRIYDGHSRRLGRSIRAVRNLPVMEALAARPPAGVNKPVLLPQPAKVYVCE